MTPEIAREATEPFAMVEANPHNTVRHHDEDHRTRSRGISKASTIASVAKTFKESTPPEGFMSATGQITSTIAAEAAQTGAESSVHKHGRSAEQMGQVNVREDATAGGRHRSEGMALEADFTRPFANGYHFPPKHSWQQSSKTGLWAFWKFFITPMGFFWTIYGLNVVAWGGMIFLLLCNASPAMCPAPHGCNGFDSPRRVWIEIDSQILTALFCVTGLGLAPWRFRDLYYLMQYRVMGNHGSLRRLAGINRSWFRLPGSQELPVEVGPGNVSANIRPDTIAIPEKYQPDAPLTGIRASPTTLWKLDFVIWSMVLNTLSQCGLCGIMWGMDRRTRPSWLTGFLVAVACIVGIVGGLVIFLEGKKVKTIEGVPCTEEDLKKLAHDKEIGLIHYNNIKDRRPKDYGAKQSRNT